MAIIDKHDVTKAAFVAVTNIAAMANDLKAMAGAGAIPFNNLRGRLDSMRSSYLNGVQPLLSVGAAGTVNPVITAFYAGSVPGNPYTAFQAVGTALLALYNAYDVVFDTLTPIVHEPLTGHAYADISVNQLATLGDELDAVIAACAPLL